MTLFSCFKVNVNVNSPFECRICKKSHTLRNVVKLISAVSLIKFIYSCVISTDRYGEKKTQKRVKITPLLWGFQR